MAIEMVKIRATVSFAGISISTPYIQSFSVKKQRGQFSTFDASLKVRSETFSSSASAGSLVTIEAGTQGNEKKIFTGICKAAKISPCYDDPYYVILSISGTDILSFLQGKQYTRRCIKTNSAWAAITSVTRPGLKSGKFRYEVRGMSLGPDSTSTADPAVGSTHLSPGNPNKSPDTTVDGQVIPLNIQYNNN